MTWGLEGDCNRVVESDGQRVVESDVTFRGEGCRNWEGEYSLEAAMRRKEITYLTSRPAV